ncbi:hypothetical protein K466DRAFT_588029 [Polyporus arcularius HHB13444]|uniref:Uncharacterized protein n=1 Tax=Polyporus arcularius HHB13444 TaxID=1314778 RepID=A0A5C3P7N8_9APHY|nr:hypothetical protein K466DRAFT_588029 [Polyporus arcularius HHB13444]
MSSGGCRTTKRSMPSATRRRAPPGNRTVAERTPRLNILVFSTPVRPLCLAPLAASTRIEHLALRKTPLDVDLLRSLGALGGLKSLTLSFVTVYDHDATEQSAPMHGLRRLRALTIAARAHDMTHFSTTSTQTNA